MIRDFIETPLEELQAEAFKIRKAHFGKIITFAIPGTVSYQDARFPSVKEHFAAISVTGRHCELRCEHCEGRLLESMIPAGDPEAFLRAVRHLQARGALGILVSGGADRNGEVPLGRFIPAIGALKEENPDFKIVVHTGLLRKETAEKLKGARVDQVLIDVIGDDQTIREVYHLDKRVADYEETLRMLKEMGHRIAPHIIIGHHFGRIKGEWRALEMITRIGVETIVLVILKPLNGLPDGRFQIPGPEETSRISAAARLLNPSTPIRMGCIRPAHPSKSKTERGAIDSGLNTIAYPLQATIDYAEEAGLEAKFVEMCCSLI
jgi:hypothetical protein